MGTRRFLFRKRNTTLMLLLLIVLASCNSKPSVSNQPVNDNFIGSSSCRECHGRFYNLWASSHHGLAMQPITANFVRTQIELVQNPINMEGASYQAVKKDTSLLIREQKDGSLEKVLSDM